MKKVQLSFDEDTLAAIGKVSRFSGYYRDGFMRYALLKYCAEHAAKNGDMKLSEDLKLCILRLRLNRVPGYRGSKASAAEPKVPKPKYKERYTGYAWSYKCHMWAKGDMRLKDVLIGMEDFFSKAEDGERCLDYVMSDVLNMARTLGYDADPAGSLRLAVCRMTGHGMPEDYRVLHP